MSHLHLVTDTKPAKRPRGRAPGLSLSRDEEKHLYAALRGLAKTRYPTLAALARELGVHPSILTPGRKRRPHPGLAVALWRLTGIPLDVLLTGKLAVVPATLDAPSPGGIA